MASGGDAMRIQLPQLQSAPALTWPFQPASAGLIGLHYSNMQLLREVGRSPPMQALIPGKGGGDLFMPGKLSD